MDLYFHNRIAISQIHHEAIFCNAAFHNAILMIQSSVKVVESYCFIEWNIISQENWEKSLLGKIGNAMKSREPHKSNHKSNHKSSVELLVKEKEQNDSQELLYLRYIGVERCIEITRYHEL